uniref:SANT domain-containing protein n=1 Tax=Panagrolaimus sp. JU765 TaxID=591449 RepID=A0AC34QX72_9BILA
MSSNPNPDPSEHVDDGDDYIADEDDGVDIEDTIAEDELHEIDVEGELADLQEEAEMDIEELRRKYYSAPPPEAEETADEAETSHSELYAFIQAENGEVEGYDSDEDADFDVNFYKAPRVGSAFQEMNIPEVDSTYTVAPDADILWKPTDKLTNDQINEYQESVVQQSQEMVENKLPCAPGVGIPPKTTDSYTFWDSEEALFLLMKYDIKHFELGLHSYGKKFYKIRSEYLPGRSIGEIIHMYYRFKKSERWDMFVQEHHEKYGGLIHADHTDPMEDMINLIQRSAVPPDQATIIIAQSEEYTISEKNTAE